MKLLLKRALPFVVLFLASCSSSQFTLYKPTDSDPAWRVTFEKKAISNKFVCMINDTAVVEESFGFFSDSF